MVLDVQTTVVAFSVAVVVVVDLISWADTVATVVYCDAVVVVGVVDVLCARSSRLS